MLRSVPNQVNWRSPGAAPAARHAMRNLRIENPIFKARRAKSRRVARDRYENDSFTQPEQCTAAARTM
jgi:hypothetical protein